jgi:hypothetical protein
LNALSVARKLANLALKPFGYEIEVRRSPDVLHSQGHRRVWFGSPTILGSFPPRDAFQSIGRVENYFIHDGYLARSDSAHFDDFADIDGAADSQLEVYQFARELCDREQLSIICDVGCGAAVKLMQYFSDRTTVGIDVPKTCERLEKTWPGRLWLNTLETLPPWPVDLLIASDVIEHLPDPNALFHYIIRVKPRRIIISTPERDLIRDGKYNGPPANPAHVREWNFAEFRAYVDSFFEVDEHFVSCAAQFTQCMLCHLRPNRLASTEAEPKNSN